MAAKNVQPFHLNFQESVLVGKVESDPRHTLVYQGIFYFLLSIVVCVFSSEVVDLTPVHT